MLQHGRKEGNTLSEINQSPKDEFHSYDVSKVFKSIEIQSRMVVTMDGGRRKCGVDIEKVQSFRVAK